MVSNWCKNQKFEEVAMSWNLIKFAFFFDPLTFQNSGLIRAAQNI